MRPLLDNIDEVNSEGASGQPPLPESAEPLPTVAQTSTQRQAFSFFRSYRFPPRPLAGMTGEAVTDSGTEPADPALSRPTEISRPSVPSEDDDMDGEGSSPPDTRSVPASIPAGQTTATASAGTGTSAPQIVPMLLVGVRSASLQGLTDAESNITASSPDTPRPTTSIDDPMTGSTVQHNDDPSTRNASSSHPRPSGGERDGSGTSGFVLWILGGLYPASHPIVIAPSLMGDDAMSYDELLRLAEVLGNVKPPTVSRDEIKKSDLKVVKSQTIGELYANGAVREITSERCLGEYFRARDFPFWVFLFANCAYICSLSRRLRR